MVLKKKLKIISSLFFVVIVLCSCVASAGAAYRPYSYCNHSIVTITSKPEYQYIETVSMPLMADTANVVYRASIDGYTGLGGFDSYVLSGYFDLINNPITYSVPATEVGGTFYYYVRGYLASLEEDGLILENIVFNTLAEPAPVDGVYTDTIDLNFRTSTSNNAFADFETAYRGEVPDRPFFVGEIIIANEMYTNEVGYVEFTQTLSPDDGGNPPWVDLFYQEPVVNEYYTNYDLIPQGSLNIYSNGEYVPVRIDGDKIYYYSAYNVDVAQDMGDINLGWFLTVFNSFLNTPFIGDFTFGQMLSVLFVVAAFVFALRVVFHK